MKTSEVIPNQSIKQQINFQTPAGDRDANVYWRFEKVNEGTKVIWGMQGEHGLIDKAYQSIFKTDFDTDIRNMLTEGLTGLREM